MRMFEKGLVLTAALMLGAVQPASAQSHATDRGSIRVGGSAGFNSLEAGDERVTNINFQPDLVYFIRPGLGLGGALSYSRSSDGDISSTSYGIGPEASFYFGTQPMRPFLSAGFFISRSSSSLSTAHVTGTSWEGSAGLLFLLSSSVGLTGEAFYRDNQTRESDTESSTSLSIFGLRFGFAAFLF